MLILLVLNALKLVNWANACVALALSVRYERVAPQETHGGTSKKLTRSAQMYREGNSASMTPSRHKFVRKTFALAILTFLALSVLGPTLFTDPPSHMTVGTAQADNRHVLKVSTPMLLLEHPNVVIERGEITVTPVDDNKVVDEAERATQLQNGSASIAIDGAKIVLDQTGATFDGETPSDTMQSVLRAMAAMTVKSLTIRDAKLTTKQPASSGEVSIGRLTCDLTKAGGLLRAKGTILRYGVTLPFDVSINLKTMVPDRYPLSVHIASDAVNADFTGEWIRGNQLNLAAPTASISTDNFKNLLQMLGGTQVAGQGLEQFRAKGTLAWTDATWTLDSADLVIDGNEATGGLSLTFAEGRPALDGTLAFSNLELTPYIRALPATLGFAENFMSWSRWLIGDPTSRSLVHHVDADLRISAASVTMNGMTLGHGAATVTMKDSKLLADLAEVELENEASGEARISVDLTAAEPRYELRGSLEAADLGRLTRMVSGKEMVSGSGTATVQITASGATQQDFRKTLAGSGSLLMPDGGKIRFDVSSLIAAVKTGAPNWTQAASGSTDVESLEAKFVASEGLLTATDVEARTSTRQLQAEGTLNLSSNTIELSIVSAATSSPTAPPTSGEKLRITGPLLAPKITLENGPSKALLRDRSRSDGFASLP